MPPLAIAFLLGSAFLHASWNVMLARARDSSASLAIAMVVGSVVVLPLAVLTWRVEPEAIPYVIASCFFELAYFATLGFAYGRAEVSLVYPIGRGLAPVLVLVGAVLFIGASATAIQAVGIVLVGLGVVLVRGIRAPARASDVGIAVLIAVFIAGYTLVDKQGLRYADPLSYLVLVVGIPGGAYLAFLIARDGVGRIRAATSPSVLVGGIAVVVAYGLVLAALAIAHAASVAAIREVGVVIATAMAAVILHERVERSRWIGSVVVVAGIALVVAS